MTNRTKYVEKIIKNYYNNRGEIALQRVQELVSELYLSEGKARERHWKNMATHLEKLGVKPAQIEHLRQKDNPELLANFVAGLVKKSE